MKNYIIVTFDCEHCNTRQTGIVPAMYEILKCCKCSETSLATVRNVRAIHSTENTWAPKKSN